MQVPNPVQNRILLITFLLLLAPLKCMKFFRTGNQSNPQSDPFTNIQQENNIQKLLNSEATPKLHSQSQAELDAEAQMTYDSIDDSHPFDLLTFPYRGSLPPSESIHDMRFHMDYTNVKNLSSEESAFLRAFIIPRAMEKIASVVRVKHRETLQFDKELSQCQDEYVKISKFYFKNEILADVVIFVNAVEIPSDTHAMTAPCYFSRKTQRTLAANLIFNSLYLKMATQSVEEAVETVQHETIHALVFDSNLFDFFPNNRKNLSFRYQSQSGLTYLRGNTLIDQARKYFQCKILGY